MVGRTVHTDEFSESHWPACQLRSYCYGVSYYYGVSAGDLASVWADWGVIGPEQVVAGNIMQEVYVFTSAGIVAYVSPQFYFSLEEYD